MGDEDYLLTCERCGTRLKGGVFLCFACWQRSRRESCEEKAAKIKQLRDQGVPRRLIAKRLGMSSATVGSAYHHIYGAIGRHSDPSWSDYDLKIYLVLVYEVNGFSKAAKALGVNRAVFIARMKRRGYNLKKAKQEGEKLLDWYRKEMKCQCTLPIKNGARGAAKT